MRFQSEAKQHECHILLVRNYTFEQHLHSSEQRNTYFLEIKHTNPEISVLPLTVENIGT